MGRMLLPHLFSERLESGSVRCRGFTESAVAQGLIKYDLDPSVILLPGRHAWMTG
jgi:hypothetical protein